MNINKKELAIYKLMIKFKEKVSHLVEINEGLESELLSKKIQSDMEKSLDPIIECIEKGEGIKEGDRHAVSIYFKEYKKNFLLMKNMLNKGDNRDSKRTSSSQKGKEEG